MKNALLYIILTALPLIGFAQTGNGYNFGRIDAGFQFSGGFDFNHQDISVILKPGFIDKENLWSAGAEFGFRPNRKIVEQRAGDNLLIQYRERRYLLGGFAEKNFLPFEGRKMKSGFQAGVSGGMQTTNFSGISGSNNGWWIAPYGGFVMQHGKNILTSVGYRYDRNISELTPHKVYLYITAF
jgi:hypothetical protein